MTSAFKFFNSLFQNDKNISEYIPKIFWTLKFYKKIDFEKKNSTVTCVSLNNVILFYLNGSS